MPIWFPPPGEEKKRNRRRPQICTKFDDSYDIIFYRDGDTLLFLVNMACVYDTIPLVF